MPEFHPKYNGLYQIFATGSSVICHPPVLDTDRDWVVYLPNGDHINFIDDLVLDGWEICGNYEPGLFEAFRKGTDNIILVRDENVFNNYYLATKVATRLNLRDKADRILVFEAIIFGRYNYIGDLELPF